MDTTSLAEAICDGELVRAQQILGAGADPNGTDVLGYPAIMRAAGGGHLMLTSQLLEAGADPSRLDPDGGNALFAAVEGGHTEIALLLLANGVDPKHRNSLGNTALKAGLEEGHSAAVLALLNHDVDPPRGLLAEAALHGDVAIVRHLLDNGFPVDDKEASYDYIDAYAEFDDGRASEAEAEDAGGLNFGDAEHEDLAENSAGRTALIAVAELFTVVYEKDPDIDLMECDDNFRWLQQAKSRQLEIARLLLQAGANVNAHDALGRTSLLAAAGMETMVVVRRDAVAEVELELSIGSEIDPAPLIEVLLANGAKISAQDHEGRTALHYLADAQVWMELDDIPLPFGYLPKSPVNPDVVARRLLAAGADPKATDNKGRSAIDLARASNNTRLLSLITRSEAKDSVEDGG